MLETVRHWIMTLTATALVCALVKSLSPEGAVKRVVSFVCGLAMMAALLSLALDVDGAGIAEYVYRFSKEGGALTDEAGEAASRETRIIIERRCEAYILDKAAQLGADVSRVRVTAKWSGGGFWYPESAELRGTESRELSAMMESELGILRENQIWSTDDGT